MDPGSRPGRRGGLLTNSHPRYELVPAIIGEKLSAALPSYRSAARGGGSARRGIEGAVRAVGAAGRLAAGGEVRAGGADAEQQQCGGDNLDDQSHGPVLPNYFAQN